MAMNGSSDVRPESDDGMSAVSPEEVAERQRLLDIRSHEFVAAYPVGVIIDNNELYSDGSYRPILPPAGPSPGAVCYPGSLGPQHFNIGSPPDLVPSGQSTPRRRAR